MADTGLSPPGSSIYSTSTLYVGDGTWDSERNSFLLPNLMGLNFATMQYNGMGNRFRDLPQYQVLILGHGILAAITFIVVVPTAIFVAKYGHWNRRHSFKLHVYLQILTVFLATVILILGWFAVGPERSLTNPHHGIGVAIYVLILFQFLWGWLMAKIERRRKTMPSKIPLKIWLHKLLGRSIAILAFVQIALGLTLYGSPVALFVVYALAGFILLFLYLSLEYYYKDRLPGGPPRSGGPGSYYSDHDSYISGTQMTQDQRRRPEQKSHWGRNLLAGAGALGAYEAWKHRRDRKRQEQADGRVSTVGGYDTPGRPAQHGDSTITPVRPNRLTRHRHDDALPPGTPYDNRPGMTESRLSPESWEDEKYSSPRKHTWRDRLLGAGAGIAAFEGVRRVFGRKKQSDDPYVDDYRPSGTHHNNNTTQTDVSRIEHGQAPQSPDDSRRHDTSSNLHHTGPNGMQPSHDSHSDGYYEDGRPHTLRDSIAVYGALNGFQNWMSQRRHRRQQARYGDNYAADDQYSRPGANPGQGRPDAGSMTETDLSGVTHDQVTTGHAAMRPDVNHPPLPGNAGAMPLAAGLAAGAVAGNALAHHSRHNTAHDDRHDVAQTTYTLPPPPPGPPPHTLQSQPPVIPGSAHMPSGAIEPDPNRLLANNTAANEGSAYGRVPTDNGQAAALAAGMLAGRAGRTQSESPSRYQRPMRPDMMMPGPSNVPQAGLANSPPVSLKVKMHNDSGGHVTLQRLSEEEAAAERARRRRERRQGRRNSSLSSDVGDEAAPPRFRRNGPVVPSASQPISNVPPPPAMSSTAGSGRRNSELNLPPMQAPQSQMSSPPYPPSAQAGGSGMIHSVGSPGPYTTDAGTDVSAFADNRRRRRAERARQQREGNGPRVEFE